MVLRSFGGGEAVDYINFLKNIFYEPDEQKPLDVNIGIGCYGDGYILHNDAAYVIRFCVLIFG
jgi:hypothetical protein